VLLLGIVALNAFLGALCLLVLVADCVLFGALGIRGFLRRSLD
jgi:hypothetical protein